VPGQWLDQSFLLRATTPGGLGYGFQWWLGEHALSKQQFIAGLGNGGQRLFVLRGLDVVVVEMAGNYNRPSATPMAVLDTVLGALT
jgi:CubicO group peptidase (beta-lactamase class C family)